MLEVIELISACFEARREPESNRGLWPKVNWEPPPVLPSDGYCCLFQAMPHHECLPWKLSNSKCITVRGRVPERPFR